MTTFDQMSEYEQSYILDSVDLFVLRMQQIDPNNVMDDEQYAQLVYLVVYYPDLHEAMEDLTDCANVDVPMQYTIFKQILGEYIEYHCLSLRVDHNDYERYQKTGVLHER